ncbi:MAG: Hsp70 family protein [Candidatus Contendobacter sp.]
MSEPRYAVGIDLGTTHCVMAAVDLAASDRDDVVERIEPIPQLTAPGAVEERTMLPSFLYLPHPDELRAEDRVLPWGESAPFVVGELARVMGGRTPIRLVASAKSWLCHPGVDRRAAILPVDAPEEVARVSPLQASICYLEYLRAAWDHQHPDAPLTEQEVVLTVPASFDPAARELTAEAAAAVGLSRHLVLLEEPQAALYHWILAAQGEWRKQVRIGDIILVVDLGGGTADFSLIAVTERDGSLELVRVAVGDHILLGGDNMDLALAHAVRTKLAGQGVNLDPWQLQALTHGCRNAKETLLGDAGVEAVPVVVPSRGSKLIGGTLRTELTRAEVTRNLVEGFFPLVEASARPASRARAALTKLGLPYAQDAAMTRHLAAFLGRQVGATRDLAGFDRRMPEHASFLHPTAVLFNGGVFKAPLLLARTLEVLNGWLEDEEAPPVRLLEGADLDLAVARGAAYYGYVRRGRGVRIRGGAAKSYYVGVESAMPAVPGLEPPIEALCIAPFGMEEGTQAELPSQEVGLVVGEPVRFRFFGSSVRRADQVGAVLEQWTPDEVEELEEIEATLPAEGRQPGEVVPVRLHAAVTEVGTLRLEAVPRTGEESWKIEFDVRGEG